MKLFLPSVLLIFVSISACLAQHRMGGGKSSGFGTFDSGVELNGVVKHPTGASVANLTVELSDPIKHETVTAAVSSTGEFAFSGIPVGTYTLRVVTMTGGLIAEKLVEVRESFNQVDVELPAEEGAKPGTGTVSIAQLLHRVPNNAMKYFKNALKAVQKKDPDTAIGWLEKAVAIDPEFVEAQADLGRLYVQKHEPDKVLAAFGQVLKMNPRSEIAYAGSCVALIWQQKYSDAEVAARHALEINPASPASNYFLGLSLATQGKYDQEAVEHLDKGSSLYPGARITAAEILARGRKYSAATEELQGYLKTGVTAHRQQVTSFLERLKKAEASQ